MMTSNKRPRVAGTTGGMAQEITAPMHDDRTVLVEDYPQIQRLWREIGSLTYVARNQGLTEAQVLAICVGEGVPYDASRYVTAAEIRELARKACS